MGSAGPDGFACSGISWSDSEVRDDLTVMEEVGAVHPEGAKRRQRFSKHGSSSSSVTIFFEEHVGIQIGKVPVRLDGCEVWARSEFLSGMQANVVLEIEEESTVEERNIVTFAID